MAVGRKHLGRPLAGACLLALALALGACGDDDDENAETGPTPTATTPTATATTEETAPETVPETTESQPEPETEKGAETAPTTSPEDRPGGAGDEEAARTLALFTGKGGRITPRVVRVPAFISVRVELRSEDGREYGLLFPNETRRVRIRVSGSLGSASSAIDGLRPGEAVTGDPIGSGTPVRIEATAAPGP